MKSEELRVKNARKATELRQVEVAPAGRLSRYRENLRVSTKSIKSEE